MKNFITIIFTMLLSVSLTGQTNFSTSLHATRNGKTFAYKAENGGMELITNIPMDDLTCNKCHSGTEFYPNGDAINSATYTPSCKDCHDFSKGNTVAEQTCLNCHNRQVYERTAYPDVDVHKAKGLTCINCHSKQEIHGDDGVAYNSLYELGAIKVKCEDCHTPLPSNYAHGLHVETVECAACHAEGVLSCASCHFESLLATGKNRAINQLKNYNLLVKKKNGKIGLGAFMTHTYDGKTNYIINAYHSHAITKNATTCEDYHYNRGAINVAIKEYNETGFITMTKWNPTTKKIMGPSGVVPLTSDWKTSLKFDFASYTGDAAVVTSDPQAWTFLKSGADNGHLFFAEPLDDETLVKLGVTRIPSSVTDFVKFNLYQNFPNPFNNNTTIKYNLNENANVSLKVYDATGKLLATLVDSKQMQGDHEVEFTAQNVPNGILFYKLEVNGKTTFEKMVHIN